MHNYTDKIDGASIVVMQSDTKHETDAMCSVNTYCEKEDMLSLSQQLAKLSEKT